jgi:hypothetical protein
MVMLKGRTTMLGGGTKGEMVRGRPFFYGEEHPSTSYLRTPLGAGPHKSMRGKKRNSQQRMDTKVLRVT